MADPQYPPIPYEGRHTEDELELFGEFRWMYPILIDGEWVRVPEDNWVLRALQYVEMKHRTIRLPYWNYCWNNTVGCCDMVYRDHPDGPQKQGRACCTPIKPGMEIVRLPSGGKICKPK